MPSKANKKAAAAERAAKLAAEAAANPQVESVNREEAAAPPSAQLGAVSIKTSTENSGSSMEYTPPQTMKALQDNKNTVEITTNSFPIEIKKVVINRYDVDVVKVEMWRNKEGKEEKKEFGLAGGEGADRKQQLELHELLGLIGKSEKWDWTHMAYDGAATLHTVGELKISKKEFQFTPDQLSTNLRNSLFRGKSGFLRVSITKNTKTPSLISTDILNESLSSNAIPVTQMLQIVLSQEARREGMLIKRSQYFEKNGSKSDKSHAMNVNGLEVGVKVAVGASGQGAIHLIIDHTKKQFFVEGPLSNLSRDNAHPREKEQKVDFTNRSKALKYIKGLKVRVSYSTEEFAIQNLSYQPASELTYEADNKTISVLEDSAAKAKKDIKTYNPRWLAVQKTSFNKKLNKKVTYSFPIENLTLVKNQTLCPNHGKPPTAVISSERFKLTKEVGETAHLLSRNVTLENFGFKINPKPIKVEATRVSTPTIHYRGERSPIATAVPNLETGKWMIPKRATFIAPATIGSLLVLYNTEECEDNRQKGFLREAVDRIDHLKGICAQLGLQINEIKRENLADRGLTVEEAIKRRFAALGQLPDEKKPFVVYIDHSKSDTHELLKLQERLAGVVVQQMSYDRSLKNTGYSTMVNLAMKLNLKAGGLNHKVSPHSSIKHLWGDQSNTLIMSYDVCHASGEKLYKAREVCEEPSCVGFTYNGTANPEAFMGDFNYQLPRKEEVDEKILKLRTRLFLVEYMNARRKFPENIVILRDGVSEGQHAMVFKNEFPAIQKGVEEFMTANKLTKMPKFAFLLGLKRHDNRLYVEKSEIGNAPPLIAIDTVIVKKSGNEVILLSHVPLKGTAQPVIIDTIVNENVFKSKDELINFIIVMSCAHQVSLNIVSLPDAIYGADDYAKRGSMIFSAYKSHNKPSFKMIDVQDKDGNEYPQIDWDWVSSELSYYKTKFKSRRVA